MSTPRPAYPLTLLYDASCPVCRLEMDALRHRDRAGRLRFADISAAQFDLASHWPTAGRVPPQPSLPEMNAALHGIGADGVVYTGLDTIRMAYAAVGLGWLWMPTTLPVLRPLSGLAYRLFARHRYAISRRFAPLIDQIAQRRARAQTERMQRCHDAQSGSPGGRCDM